MQYNIRVEQHAGGPLAVVRRRAKKTELSKVVPEACGIVWNALRANQVNGAGRHVAVYLDGVINLEVGVELDAPLPGPIRTEGVADDGAVVPSTTPAGRVAATTHHGPYQNLNQAHDAIHQWCKQNGHALAGPFWEIYGHWTDECNRDPSKITTDVCYLLS
jgi:effector-binding domain-containing protein